MVFTGPYGLHFETKDTPSLRVLHVVPESPAFSQGVRPGSRLWRINGMQVQRLSLQEVQALTLGGTCII